jgi:hypothetical protein
MKKSRCIHALQILCLFLGSHAAIHAGSSHYSISEDGRPFIQKGEYGVINLQGYTITLGENGPKFTPLPNGNWSEIGGGTDNIVKTMVFDATGNIYVGGYFSQLHQKPWF